jgi:hypothetical protein
MYRLIPSLLFASIADGQPVVWHNLRQEPCVAIHFSCQLISHISPYHTIPYHTIPYHTIIPSHPRRRCVYIHGRPFCVKERDNPFKALANRGVRADDVEEAEVLPLALT